MRRSNLVAACWTGYVLWPRNVPCHSVLGARPHLAAEQQPRRPGGVEQRPREVPGPEVAEVAGGAAVAVAAAGQGVPPPPRHPHCHLHSGK